MSTYIIGDVQGCYAELIALLDVIGFDKQRDRLGFVGDLVNRGPSSLETLRFIKGLPEPIVVLGNHDLHLLALGYGVVSYKGRHTLNEVLEAPDKMELLEWLRHRPLLHYEASFDAIIVHAGIPPQWRLVQALEHAEELAGQLRSADFKTCLRQLEMRDDPFPAWRDDLSGWPRSRYIMNAFMHMRFCTLDGQLDIKNKTAQSTDPQKWRPWFEWYALPHRVLYGHWAALEGRSSHPHCEALDTGCVYGRELTAYRLEDNRRFSVPALKPQVR